MKSPKMTLSVDIKPELEERLLARALSHGQSLEVFIQHLLENEALDSQPSPSTQSNTAPALTGPEKAAAFEAWANSFPANLPILSLESVSREKIYQRD